MNAQPLPNLRIAQGGTRLVFLIDGLAIKVPLPGKPEIGRRANLVEAELFARAADDRLCPILASHPAGDWLVMPLCEPVTDGEVRGAGARRWIPDYATKNFGRLDGRLVVLDYAGSRGEGVTLP